MTSPFILFTGPVFIASIFNWALYGVLILQIYNFSQSFPRERAGIKILVYTLLVLDTAQSVFATHFAWGILVAGWGDQAVIPAITWSGITIPIMTGLVSAIVQIFFAWRIWVLKPNSKVAVGMAILIVIVALIQSSAAFAGGIKTANAKTIAQFRNLTTIATVWLTGSFVCDILIAGTMIYILSVARSGTAFRKTNSLINKLIINAVETGAITAVTACAELILFKTMSGNFIHEVPALTLGKMYSNVVLATLNGRVRNRSTFHSNGGTSQEGGSDSHQLSLRPNYIASGRDTDKTLIHVSTDVAVDDTRPVKIPPV